MNMTIINCMAKTPSPYGGAIRQVEVTPNANLANSESKGEEANEHEYPESGSAR